MNQGFNFNSQKYDFWSVYEAIKKYYPIGIEREYPGIFFEYDGIKELENIVVQRIHDETNYHLEWVSFCEVLSEEIKLPIIGTTYGQAPSFSAYILLDEEKNRVSNYYEELHFCVSLVGTFYTIIGQSTTVVKNLEQDRFYTSVNKIESSPSKTTAKYFQILKDRIESKYQEFKFIPYFISEQKIEGLRVRYRDESTNRIFHALFNDHIKFESINIGDAYYGIEGWVK
ncbi:hypothetical protein [Cesiribacter sp. SM1]|uniref:hypothetical protein n=1 Tax=Cesiribacter sp. SM1 TaxID=2861196 RepID=UPI001CD407F6|nr:hypothetical protein [Cesiribacter sp. SM1]